MSQREIKIEELLTSNQDPAYTSMKREHTIVLVLKLRHQKAGTSWMSGNDYPAGYYLHATPEHRFAGGGMGFSIGGKLSGHASLVEKGERFSQAKLEKLARIVQQFPGYEALKAKVIAEAELQIVEPAAAAS